VVGASEAVEPYGVQTKRELATTLDALRHRHGLSYERMARTRPASHRIRTAPAQQHHPRSRRWPPCLSRPRC
jgi:hypothetical protein